MLQNILSLSVIAAFPVVFSVVFYLIEKKTKFSQLSGFTRQLIIGLVFGALSVFGSEFGVDMNTVKINVRDAAPICAGLIFGAPSGIIAGVIGGAERWFAVLWGAGTYTQLACSVSTVFSGLIAAFLRKFMFGDRKPAWYYGLATGFVCEVIHMLMIFITNMSDVSTAFTFVELCAIPMIAVNGAAVMLALLIVSLIGKERVMFRVGKRLAQEFQRWLLLVVMAAFLVTSLFTMVLQNSISTRSSYNLLTMNIKDVEDEISAASDANLLDITLSVAELIDGFGITEDNALVQIKDYIGVAEINIINKDGIIYNSTNENFIGYDMASGEQSSEFLPLLTTETKYVQPYQPISYSDTLCRKYAGVRLNNGEIVQVGYDAEEFQNDIANFTVGAAHNRRVGENGTIVIADKEWNIVSDSIVSYEGQSLLGTELYDGIENAKEDNTFYTDVFGVYSCCMFSVDEGYYIIAAIPESEVHFSRNVSVYVMVFMDIVVFVVLFVLVYVLIKRHVVDNIRSINGSLAKITQGDLSVTVDVRSNEEFASLSDDINSTVITLKSYIAEAEARIDRELEFAKTIQYSVLPSIFPAFYGKPQYDIYAAMLTAKEVGGDFYDFYYINDDTLIFLIADVSGKGIPAAMFMMTAKTMIKSYAESGIDVNDVFTKANEKLCENNEGEMFVTAWIASVNLKTGLMTFANAGHNPPLIKHKDGSYEYLKSRAGFVLAGMEGIKYRKNELQLNEGDELFLYTDGITEATDSSDELYGEDRLLNILNTLSGSSTEAICAAVKKDVDNFVGSAPQFDDMTMLSFIYKGGK